MPTVKNADSRASRSAASAADGTSTIAPTGTVPAGSPARRPLRASRARRLAHLLHRGDEREHHAQRAGGRRPQQRPQLRAQHLAAGPGRGAAPRRPGRASRRSRGAPGGRLPFVEVEGADRDRPRRQRRPAGRGRSSTCWSSVRLSGGAPGQQELRAEEADAVGAGFEQRAARRRAARGWRRAGWRRRRRYVAGPGGAARAGRGRRRAGDGGAGRSSTSSAGDGSSVHARRPCRR